MKRTGKIIGGSFILLMLVRFMELLFIQTDQTWLGENILHKLCCILLIAVGLALLGKRYFKSNQIHKNRLSAIQKWDVGVRYGNKYRKRKAIEEELEIHQKIQQTAKRSHVRCAHWQHYRTGFGRKDITLKWKEPIFVNGDYNDII